MLGTQQNRAEAASVAAAVSPLASQLQQAWLQSQIQSQQSTKLQRRGMAKDITVEKRQFQQVVPDLSSIAADHYFHKSRLEVPEFLKRPVAPQLVSYSKKADLPQRSISGSVSDVSTLSSLSSPSSSSLSPCSQSVPLREVSDCGDSGALDETEPLVRFLDDLEDLEKEKLTAQERFEYQAMAKELEALVTAPEHGAKSMDEDYDLSWTTGMVTLRTEEEFAEKLIHAYTSNLYKHVTDVTDVAENVDSSAWINERDACTDHADSQWDYYLENVREGLQDHFFVKDMSLDTFFSPGCVDLKELLLRCALVVSQDDAKSANDLIRQLRHHSSAYGNALQRLAYYYMEALVAKMSGTGAQLYMAMSSNTRSSTAMLKAHRLFVDYSPYIKVSHFFSTKIILDAFEGAEHAHVVDYGVQWGAQWPTLIQRLSQRRGGPPHLRITCLDLPQPGGKPSARVLEVGHRLAQFAKLWNVPFEFQALADKWETITPAQLCLKHDEVVAVHCQYRLESLLDESIMAASPRKVVLDRIRSMNPKVFVMLTVNANYNAPFFMTRFRESLKYYSTMFDAMEVSMPVNDPDRVVLEKGYYGREILNIVACEGVARVERAEPYMQWQTRTQRAGFSQRPLSPIMMRKIQAMMGSYHKEYGIGEDGCWFLMGWKNQIVRALTVWESTPTTQAGT